MKSKLLMLLLVILFTVRFVTGRRFPLYQRIARKVLRG